MKYLYGPLFLLTASCATLYFEVSKYKQKENTQKQIKQYSSEIANKDINRFNRINNAITHGEINNSTAKWMKEYNKMMDSLKIDSLTKKAYFEGAQMVRDSIKAATKLK